MIRPSTQTYQQLLTVLSTVQQTHFQAASILHLASLQDEDSRMSTLLKRLSHRQTQMCAFYVLVRETAGSSVVQMWMQFVPSIDLQKSMNQFLLDEEDPDLLLGDLMVMSNEIIEMIEGLKENSSNEHVIRLLEAISEREHMEVKFIARAIEEADDI